MRPATSTTHCANIVVAVLWAQCLRCVTWPVSVCAGRSSLVLAVSSVAQGSTHIQTAMCALVTLTHLWTPAVVCLVSVTADPTTVAPNVTSVHPDTTLIPAAHHVVVQWRALASVPVIQCLVSVCVCQTLRVRGVIAACLGHMASPSAKLGRVTQQALFIRISCPLWAPVSVGRM